MRLANDLSVTQVPARQPLELADASFDVAISDGWLEYEEWDRWSLQQVHAALADGGRLVLVVPNLLGLSSARDIADLAAVAFKHARRIAAKTFGDRASTMPKFVRRRYRREPLRRMLQNIGFAITHWSADGLGFGGLLAPRSASAWASRHVIECVKRPGRFGLTDAAAFPDVETHRRDYQAEHHRYLGIRDNWVALNSEFAPGPARPLEPSEYAGREVVVLSPHPDDEVISCGGVLLRLVAAGARVTVIQGTDGSAGYALRHASECDKRTIRITEAEAAARAMGAADVVCWREDNRNFRCRDDLVARLAAWLDAHRPALVFTPFVTDVHTDHRTMNAILAAAIGRSAADCSAMKVLGYEVSSLAPANRIVDVSSVIDERDALLLLYPTAMKVDDFIHRCAHQQYYNSYTYTRPPGFAEVFYEVTASQFAALLATAEPRHE